MESSADAMRIPLLARVAIYKNGYRAKIVEKNEENIWIIRLYNIILQAGEYVYFIVRPYLRLFNTYCGLLNGNTDSAYFGEG